jgi:hypothetical protein
LNLLENLLLPLQEPYRIIESSFIIAGMWLDAKLLWMLIYEIKYYRDAGMDYLDYGKFYVYWKNKIIAK